MESQSRAVVSKALARGEPTNFDELVERCAGLYPVDVADALRQLDPDGIAVEDLIASCGSQERTDDGKIAKALAAPHPLDYDWRFDDATSKALCNSAFKATRKGDVIVALGTPTVYLKAMQTIGDRTVVLHDSNAEAHDFMAVGVPRVQSIDVSTDSVPVIEVQHVIADPPWYPEYYALFLWWCAQITCPGSTISLAMAPPNARPSTEDERKELWSWARHLGMRLSSIDEGVLRYRTPLFERRALHAAGIRSIPNWRVGSLATLETVETTERSNRPLVVRDRWDRALMLQTDLRFRRVAATALDPRLIRLVDGDTLDSVSTRDPRRTKAVVWTTLNRIYGCHNPTLAFRLAQMIAQEKSGRSMDSGQLVRAAERTPSPAEMLEMEEAVEQLALLSTCESKTISNFLPKDIHV